MDPDLQDSHSGFRIRDLQCGIGDGRTIAWTAHARMRVADILVLLGAYGSAEEAKAGLAVVPRDPKQHRGVKLPAGTRWQMIKRMAYLLGVLGPAEENRGRLRAALGWAGRAPSGGNGSAARLDPAGTPPPE